ncbi:MAG: T9SS type A sorting domain-containing protein, partial [Rubricoccaceae bacterium]|nr:T9SS type A sorting domain-containing protein [Rubricoccaceae bacterium]
TAEASGTTATLNGVSFPTPEAAYAAGDGGTVLKGTFGAGVPVTLTLTPSDPPVEVFPGESFAFTVTVTNTGGPALTVDLWAEGTQTGGGFSVTRGPRTLTLAGGASQQVTRSLPVPLDAPAGAYTFTVNAGDFPGDVFASDSFPVTVLAPEATAGATSPGTLALAPSAPNPFRERTAIGYHLPEGAHVTLRVYNALGQEVARLVDGHQAPGRHEVVFDARDVPAGIYLVRLEAGSVIASRTMQLVN